MFNAEHLFLNYCILLKRFYKSLLYYNGPYKGTSGDGKRLLHFGDSSMPNNTSVAAKKSYMARSGGIRNKEGKLTKNDRNSANYWSRRNW
jgi:hypothetical protein